MSSLDPRRVDFGDNAGTAGDLESLGLRARHPPETRGYKGLSREIAVLRDPEVEPSRIQESDIGAVDDALRADVHPAAGGHLTVVDAAQRGQAMEIFRRVEHTDHQAVGDDCARRLRARREETERMPGADHQGLGVIHDLQVAFDQEVLHPVLADLARLTVCDQFVGVEGYVEVEVVVDHHLHGLRLGDAADVAVDGLSRDLSGRSVAIAVYPAPGLKLFEKLGSDDFVVFGGHVT